MLITPKKAFVEQLSEAFCDCFQEGIMTCARPIEKDLFGLSFAGAENTLNTPTPFLPSPPLLPSSFGARMI